MDHSTPNLPSRDFDKTVEFYATLGFEAAWHDRDWLILRCGALIVEFFLHSELDPASNWFSCCLRVDDLDALYKSMKAAGVVESSYGFPRLHAPTAHASGLRIGALIDPDGSLLRLIQN